VIDEIPGAYKDVGVVMANQSDLVDVVHRDSVRSGQGVALHFRKASAEDRLRRAVEPAPLQLGADGGHLTYPELAAAIERAISAMLRPRGGRT
jgi:hypothetical protein